MKNKSKTLLYPIFLSIVTVVPCQSRAAVDDLQIFQRAGISRSMGDLSISPYHLSAQAGFNSTLNSFASTMGLDLTHEVSVYYDSFKTRGENTLLFPITSLAQARILEPAITFEACAFSATPIRFCAGGGFSLVHLQTTIQNYQMYFGLPANLRLVYVARESPWFFEANARYRSFRNRIEGFVSKHADITYMLGVGYLRTAL